MRKKSRRYWVGFDMGGTKMLAAVFDERFRPVGRKRRKTRHEGGAEAGLKRMTEVIDAALADAGAGRGDLAGIGVGCPGVLDLDAGVVLSSSNLGWRKAPVKKRLERAFRCPVVLLNDVDAGVYGEWRFGAGRGARCVMGIFPGTGIGGGCVYEGEILRGRTLSCMEIGHARVLPDGPLCGCGRRGCLEAVAGRLAISSAAAVAAYRGQAPHLLRRAGMDLARIRSGDLAAAIRAGDRAVERIVRDAARWLAVAAGIGVNLLAPDLIVLGGGLVEAMPKLFLQEVRDAIGRHVMPNFEGTFRVVAAKLGDDATAMGAAAWARRVLTEGGREKGAKR
jgi:glucokinase